MTTTDNLVLYIFQGCPYCIRVTDFMTKNGIELEIRDAEIKENWDHLIAVGGKPQCPCLFIDGKPLYESLDIIDWLQKNVVDARNA